MNLPPCGRETLCAIINLVIQYLNLVLFLLMALAIVMFVIYIIKYFIKADADKKLAGTYVLYSIIGFFVILSVWGIVRIVSNSFNIRNTGGPTWEDMGALFPR